MTATLAKKFNPRQSTGVFVSALSALDLALWDIKGKMLNLPVARLIGGARAAVPAYATVGLPAFTETELIHACTAALTAGFHGAKILVGAGRSITEDAQRIRAVRGAIGGAPLMLDANCAYTVAEAKRFCRLVEDCNLLWFEEPVTADDKRGMAEVRAATAIPIAAGESEFNRFDFRDLAELRAADIFQPDLAICGGISEAMRIGAIAAAWNLKLAPHLWTGALAFAAGMHVAAASPAGWLLEYSVGANPLLQELAEEQFSVQDGMIEIPDRPGLGITIRQDFVDRYTVI